MRKSLRTVVASIGAAAMLALPASAQEVQAEPEQKKYTVVSGDSLSKIAKEQNLETWRPLWNANTNLSNPDVIFVGQEIIIPTGPTTDRPLPVAAAPAPAPVAAPAPAQAPKTAPKPKQVAKAPANFSGGAGGIFERIRQRESNGNYAINTGNGYYGAYQFDLSTWRSVGGTGYPHQASPAEQDYRAQLLYNSRGCQPWPNTCY